MSDDPTVGMFWAEPLNARRQHIFDPDNDNRALCGRWAVPGMNADHWATQVITDTDEQQTGDCVACWRRRKKLEESK